ncbi:MAG: cytochrome-c peroxidase [Bacteroidetes bacterium]|nr:cytochrome-c peroxidase [Bacteroidota bacterium]
MRYFVPLLLFLLTGTLLINACHSVDDKRKEVKPKPKLPELGTISALPLQYSSPANNPSTPEKIELGRLLFYDPILSGGKDVACATCHHPEFGYAESRELPIGVNGKGLGERRSFNKINDIPFTKRNAPTLLNIAFNGIDEKGNYIPEDAPMFWDNRAKGLEQQAMMPVSTLEEMRGHGFTETKIKGEIARRINNIPLYRKLFKEAFPNIITITDTTISQALAAFQRSLIANNSRFDRYMRGEKTALSGREINGMKLFISTGCARCHNGPMLSDFKPHVLGVVDNEKLLVSDSGYLQTYAFRTPTLRNMRFTRPYMHNGKIATLDNVMLFYEDLKGKPLPNPHVPKEQLDSLAVLLNVEFKDIDIIVEFLNTLNDEQYDKIIPVSVPSGLPVGGNIKN